MTKVTSPDERIVISCSKCGFKTPPMTQADLDQFGTPWYCPGCDAQMTRFKIGTIDELATSPIMAVAEQMRADLKTGRLYERTEQREARRATLARFRKR